jgi:N-acetylmuramoyl-L-alanine amidase
MAWIQAPMATPYDLGRSLSTTPLTHDIICAHTMVGTLNGSLAHSSNPGETYWHFGLDAHGRLVQCQDLRYRSAANLNGNWHVIPIETSDRNEGVWPTAWEPRPWTQAQIAKIVQLFAWLCVRFDIPPVLIPDSKVGRRGIGYHRQGIDPYRVDGGEKWSNSTGKTCPTDPRVGQLVNLVIPRVAELVRGGPTPPVQLGDGMFAYDLVTDSGSVQLVICAGGKQSRVIGNTVAQKIRDQDYYIGQVESQTEAWFKTTWGPVTGL